MNSKQFPSRFQKPFTKCIELSNGVQMPVIGLATQTIHFTRGYRTIVKDAINIGYRHIDTASVLINQRDLGKGLLDTFNEGKVKREDLFITTKIWNTSHREEWVVEDCKESLKQLQLTSVDLLLLHYPMAFGSDDRRSLLYLPMSQLLKGKIEYSDIDYLEAWKGMETCLEGGLTRSIGVANFNKIQLDRLVQNCKTKPMVHQFETHPYLPEEDLVNYCKDNRIAVSALWPIGGPEVKRKFGPEFDTCECRLIDHQYVKDIASKHRRTIGQVLLKYGIDRGFAVLPRTIDVARMSEYLDVNFPLDSFDAFRLDNLRKNNGGRLCPSEEFRDHKNYPW